MDTDTLKLTQMAIQATEGTHTHNVSTQAENFKESKMKKQMDYWPRTVEKDSKLIYYWERGWENLGPLDIAY